MVRPMGLPAEIVPVIVRTVAGRHLVIECYGLLLLLRLLLLLLLHLAERIAIGRRVQVGGDRVIAVDVAGAQIVGRVRCMRAGRTRAARMVVVVIDEHGRRRRRRSGHMQGRLQIGRPVEQRRIRIVVQIGGVVWVVLLMLWMVGGLGRQHSGTMLVVDVDAAAVAAMMEFARWRQRKLGDGRDGR